LEVRAAARYDAQQNPHPPKRTRHVSEMAMLDHCSSEMRALLGLLIRMDEDGQRGTPVPPLTPVQTRQLMLALTDSLLANRRRRRVLACAG
jgi:hypothetical protein